MRARVVIIGGGVMGVAIAWYAARRGDPLAEPIVLLEKKALAAGSSGRSGAILRQHYSDRVVAAMARESLRVYSSLERNTGRSIGFQQTGVITLAGPSRPADIALIERNIAMQIGIGIDTRRVEADEIRRLVPGIAIEDGTIGAFEAGGGGVDPVRTVDVLAALAREHGAITRIGTTVTDLVVRERRIAGVMTSDGIMEAEQVVVAAGPWTRNLLMRAGIDLPLRVVRPEQHFLSMPNAVSRAGSVPPSASATVRAAQRGLDEELDQRFPASRDELPPAAHPVILDLEHGFYTRCDSHTARTRIGRMDYWEDATIEDPDALDETVSASFQRWARERLERRLPSYREREDAGSMAGMYTLSPDAQALIGPLPQIAGLFVVSGFSGHGFKLAPSIGEGMAQMLRGDPVSAFDTGFFSPLRFEGRPEVWGGAFGL